jgi:hypothetical protein
VSVDEQAMRSLLDREWLASTTADDWVNVILGCLRAGDMHGVHAALRVLAVKDPQRAQDVYDTIQVGLRIRRSQGDPLPSDQA